jgi:hypothetical protein
MRPFEILYGRKCRVPISWDSPLDKTTLGPKLSKTMEWNMIKIRKKLKLAHDTLVKNQISI